MQEESIQEFIKRLDDRHFHICLADHAPVPFRGSAMSAKHAALEILEWAQAPSTVRVVDLTGVIFYQTKRQ